MTTIIIAHPWHGSLNHSILKNVIKNLNKNKKTYTLIDLYKDHFDPVLHETELALFSQGKYEDPLVEKYQNILKKTDSLIFIFPIWWADMPAILKGFLDKVMLKNFAYIEGKVKLTGLLTNITKVTVITTAHSPKWYLKYFAGNPIQGMLIRTNLKSLGMKNIKWLHCGYTKENNKNKRIQFLHTLDHNKF